MKDSTQLRPACNADSPQIQALIARCFAEYGEQVCLEGADKDLLDLHGNYDQCNGAFVVLEIDAQIRGTHAVLPMEERPEVCYLRRLYLDSDLRGSGWGDRLMVWAVEWAQEHQMKRVEFWSDIRFKRAHRFFGRYGFETDGRVRQMNDNVEPYKEIFFFLDLES
jgi:putative acetyltransferase